LIVHAGDTNNAFY